MRQLLYGSSFYCNIKTTTANCIVIFWLESSKYLALFSIVDFFFSAPKKKNYKLITRSLPMRDIIGAMIRKRKSPKKSNKPGKLMGLTLFTFQKGKNRNLIESRLSLESNDQELCQLWMTTINEILKGMANIYQLREWIGWGCHASKSIGSNYNSWKKEKFTEKGREPGKEEVNLQRAWETVELISPSNLILRWLFQLILLLFCQYVNGNPLIKKLEDSRKQNWYS